MPLERIICARRRSIFRDAVNLATRMPAVPRLDDASGASRPFTRQQRPPVFKTGMASLTDAPTRFEQGTLDALIARVGCERDVQAFETLYRYFYPKVRAYMLRTERDRSVADELAQEAMTVVWRKAHLFDPARGQASTWIFRIARNLRIDALRRGPRPNFDLDDPSLQPEPAEQADADHMRRELSETVHAAIAKLNEDQLEVLKLSYFDEMTHTAIAAKLGIPIGTVKSRIRMACARLRSVLGDNP